MLYHIESLYEISYGCQFISDITAMACTACPVFALSEKSPNLNLPKPCYAGHIQVRGDNCTKLMRESLGSTACQVSISVTV